ncbi:MAG: MFS transporter [Actinobacteria bacterium]|nr:MAG: MFS transporter [Actinomycetota bacterium]
MSEARSKLYYGWVVVSVAFMAMFVNYGVRSTQTVLIKGFAEELDIGRAAASLPFTVSVLVYAFLAPLTGRLVDRYGPRWVMVVGALISGVGLWMCSRADNLFVLVFFFGIVFGIGGNGIGLVPSNTSVAMWFRRRLGLALGVATMGIGFGTMILPRLTGAVQSQWDWRASFQFLGYVALALTVPILFLLRGQKIPSDDEGEAAAGARLGDAALPGGLTLREAMRTPSFWLLFTGFVLIVVALYGVMVHQVPYATDQGISKGWAEWSIVIYGATSIAGRLFFGRLSDRTREKKNALYPACAILLVSITILIFVREVWSLMVFAAIFGFGFAAYGPVIPAVCAEVFGKANMGAIFGAVTTGGALGGAAGPVITGFIFDKSGNYIGAWILALACVAVSTILFARVRILWRE